MPRTMPVYSTPKYTAPPCPAFIMLQKLRLRKHLGKYSMSDNLKNVKYDLFMPFSDVIGVPTNSTSLPSLLRKPVGEDVGERRVGGNG